MAKLISWIKSAATAIVDPEREERIGSINRHLRTAISKERAEFDLQSFVAKHNVHPKDVSLMTFALYREYLVKAWDDAKITEKERKTLDWLARKLEISRDDAIVLNREVGGDYFEQYLAHAMEDGVIDNDESRHLESLAEGMQTPLPILMRHYFAKQGERLLRGMFMSVINDGQLVESEWSQMLLSTKRLGLSSEDLHNAIGSQGRKFIEHVLADVKSDGRLNPGEEDTLRALLRMLKPDARFQQYVESELHALRLYTDIADGVLPSVSPPADMEIRAGEIVHFAAAATYTRVRQLKRGPVEDVFHGRVLITDNRMVFASNERTFTLNHRRIVSIRDTQHGMHIQSGARGSGHYGFGVNCQLGTAIYRASVGKANQTIVQKRTEDQPSRHIPRDVRQRVWQRYGGRCAECNSDQYLEFDHVVPVAKGGSNSDANVQLLCRGCNMKKSDRI